MIRLGSIYTLGAAADPASAAYTAARGMISATTAFDGLRAERAAPWRRFRGDKYVSTVKEGAPESEGASVTVGLATKRILSTRGLSFQEREALAERAYQIAQPLGLHVYTKTGDDRFYITFRAARVDVASRFGSRLYEGPRSVVGAVALHPQDPGFESSVKAILDAYPQRKLTKDYGIARAGQTIGVDRPLAEAIVRTARALGAHPYDLANVMHHESGFTFRPDAQSGKKLGDTFDASRATGIIQFIPGTAKLLGTTTTALHGMTAAQQMVYVQRYFERVRSGEHRDGFGSNPIPGPENGRLDTLHKVGMAVFFPRAMDWPSSKLFPAGVVAANPKAPTPGSYTRAVARTAKLASSVIPKATPAEVVAETAARVAPSPTVAAAGAGALLVGLGIAAIALTMGGQSR